TSIGQPRKLALSGGNLYFSSGNSVFKIDAAGSMTLVAGNSRPGFSGDGGPAVSAQLNTPQGIALDSAGNVYIADSLNNRVRKVDTKGIITTFAGNGNTSDPGFWGDNGPATDANIKMPVAMAVDSAGNVYIAASADNTIRKVTTDGIINIFAGAGYKGYYGDYSKDSISGKVLSDGVAIHAGITSPQDVAIGPKGAILIADTGNAVIRQVDSAGIITTISGNGSVGISGDDVATTLAMVSPFGVAVDSSGNVYVAEFGSNRIRKVDTSGKITTAIGDGTQGFAGDGGAPNKVQMNAPTSVVVDSSGNLYFADSLNNRIRKLSGGNVNTYAGNGVFSRSGDGGAATSAQLNTPLGVAVDTSVGAAGSLYIADSANHTVRRVASNGVISNFAGTGTAGSSGDQLNGPQGLAVDSAGSLYIADTQNHRVRKVTGGTISTVAGSGTAGFAGDGGAAGSAQLNAPFGVAVDAAGNLYIAEFGNNRVRKVAANGNISTLAGNGISGFSGDGGQAGSAQLNGPQGVAVDSAGNVYIADTANNRVRKVAVNGVIMTVAGNGAAGVFGDGNAAVNAQVGNPVAVAADSVGNVFIADGSGRVRKLFLSGIITTIAGAGPRGYSGDGGIAGNARLSGPSALALNAAGAVWVADTFNNAVRVLQFAGGGTTVSAVTNGASNLSGPVAPGLVVVIYGSGLGPDQLAVSQAGSNGMAPTTVGGTSVLVNGVAAPVLYASANQVAAVVPFGISQSLAQLYVQYQNVTSAPFNLSVASQIPAIFTLNGSGTGQAAAINNKDGSINGAARPAKVGEYVQLYITGAGQTNPAGTDGLINAGPGPVPVATVKVTIGGQPATVNFAGGAPGAVAGVIQVNALIPAGITPGAAVPVVVQVGTSNSQPGVTIAVAN
ncbi:MAG: SMP-30/gluconolactonase/LRE family protein, partial [Candidatus Solibacter sp.]|nr:SMP-30/gluconolactonase/LRE family protein [Candidatus Solibacter sp.]